MAKGPSLLKYLSLTEVGENKWNHVFPKLSKIQTVSSRIWTQVVNPISYNANHYTKCISITDYQHKKKLTKSDYIYFVQMQFGNAWTYFFLSSTTLPYSWMKGLVPFMPQSLMEERVGELLFEKIPLP